MDETRSINKAAEIRPIKATTEFDQSIQLMKRDQSMQLLKNRSTNARAEIQPLIHQLKLDQSMLIL